MDEDEERAKRIKEIALEMATHAVKEGKLIEAGWSAFRIIIIHPEATAKQLENARMAFFAGAQHLYGSLISVLDPGAEPTANDLIMMEKIHNELEAWKKETKVLVDVRPVNKDKR